MLQVKFENLGPIKEGVIQMNKLTVLCGENHTGKTYASYTIYGLMKELRFNSWLYDSVIEQIDISDESDRIDIDLDLAIKQIPNLVKNVGSKITASLYKFFSTNEGFFRNSKISVQLDIERLRSEMHKFEIEFIEYNLSDGDKAVIEIQKPSMSMNAKVSYRHGSNINIKDSKKYVAMMIDLNFESVFMPFSFLLPAERSGLNLFYKELNAARNQLIHGLGVELLNEKVNNLQKHLKQHISPYPEPISDYLTFLNRFDVRSNEKGTFKDIAEELQRTILKGSYEIQDQQILYKNEGGQTFRLHISSSTVKSLFGLVFYLTYMAEPGQTLIIDEPELNLHPDNQRKLAKILAKIANRGIWVILSTHSDYIVKEFNNLIMLSKTTKKRDELMQKYDYHESQLLKPDDVSAYLFIDDRITPMEIDPNEGIIAETFDQVINRHNEATDEIYYAIQEEE